MDNQTWIKKLNRSRYVERQILNWIKRNFDPSALLPEPHVPEYDIYSPKMGNVEVKEDRIAHATDNYAIEFEDGSGKPSGIEFTTAKFFVLVDCEFVILTATESLKYVIRSRKDTQPVLMGYKFNHGQRAKGWLLPRICLLNNPFTHVTKRWFPVIQEHDVRTN